MIGILSDPDLYERAGKVYGFAAPPDPVTLSPRQVEILEGIARLLFEIKFMKAGMRAAAKLLDDGVTPEAISELLKLAGTET